MQYDLAERLPAEIMDWTDEEKVAACAHFESFANYKYDEYQQYKPGRRFLESFVLWLRQFETKDERRTAYEFVRDRIVFISEAEMNHLVELAFPMHLRPHLIKLAKRDTGYSRFHVREITNSIPYQQHRRRTLVLGMSDGARTGQFRRVNSYDITNEHIWHAYDISTDKAEDLKQELIKDIANLNEKADKDDLQAEPSFETIVLLDDFTASGKTFLRKEKGKWKGKIHKVLNMLEDKNKVLGSLMCDSEIRVIVIFYVATTQAIECLKYLLKKRGFVRGEVEFHVVHCLDSEQKLTPPRDKGILGLVENDKYWDKRADDRHAKIGGTSCRKGYAGCALPVILSHNTPNNSIFLLWAEEHRSVQGLFPRVSRHRTFG